MLVLVSIMLHATKSEMSSFISSEDILTRPQKLQEPRDALCQSKCTNTRNITRIILKYTVIATLASILAVYQSQCSMIVLTLLYKSVQPILWRYADFGGSDSKTLKPIDEKFCVWVIMLAITPSMLQFKTIAPFGPLRPMREILPPWGF